MYTAVGVNTHIYLYIPLVELAQLNSAHFVAYYIQQYVSCKISVLKRRVYVCSMFGLRKEPKEQELERGDGIG